MLTLPAICNAELHVTAACFDLTTQKKRKVSKANIQQFSVPRRTAMMVPLLGLRISVLLR